MAEYFTVWLDGAGDELDRLAAGPPPEIIARMEAALLEGYLGTERRVHVITGELRASGHPQSSWEQWVWSGQINFARYPGIFELARGDAPTRHHPYPGDHYFFGPPGTGPGPVFERGVRQAFWDWVTDYKGGLAPDGGLDARSGGG
jgi:hypothetical protein